ncbi:MAG: VanW family protein [Deltaproteobacteria bacterium]|nr:VanW family protein [Deltaproteobacteria bacterium]
MSEGDRSKIRRAPARALLAFLLGLLLLPVVAFGVDHVRFSGKVFRGVRAGALPLAGFREAEAREAIEGRVASLALETLDVRIGDTTVVVALHELGYRIDVDATVIQALAARRPTGFARIRSWMSSLVAELDVGLVTTIDDAKLGPLLDRWEREHVLGPFEGAVEVKDGVPLAAPPRLGHSVDRAAAARELVSLAAKAEFSELGKPRVLALPLVERSARRTAAHVEAALAAARELVAGPIALYVDRRALATEDEPKTGTTPASRAASEEIPDERITVSFSGAQLIGALRSRLVEEPLGVEAFLDPSAIDSVLGDLRKVVEEPSVEPHFEIDPTERASVVPGRAGRVVKADAVVAALTAAARTETREGRLPVEPGAAPTMTVAELEQLGITRLVSKFTTSHPCCMPRVDNIHRIADLIDGVIVKTGETFSVNAHVGERTVDKGFKAAPTIVHGEMEDTIGGGISQFATTLFNAAFYGGYDILERKPHSFYIPRYPMGHEATLSYPKPDLVIKNDTSAGMLIRCLYTKTSITVKLYGDNGGRRVRRKVSHVRDIVQPPVEFLPDSTLEPDDEKVKERGQVGWTVTVSRLIDFPGGTTRNDERKVVYQPRVRRVRVHPCKIPAGQKGATGEKCPEAADAGDDGHEATEAPADVPRDGDVYPDAPVEDEG